MKIAETIGEVRTQVAAWKRAGLTVGLVPTMGYLHEGHMSLVEEAARRCDRVVASVFVNPHRFSVRLRLLGFRVGLAHRRFQRHNANHGSQERATQYEIENFTEFHEITCSVPCL